MKKKLPWISIICLIIATAVGLVLAIDMDGWLLIPLCWLLILPSIIAEIVGIVMCKKKGKKYTDCLAVLITNAVILVMVVAFGVYDMCTSTGWFAGLLGLVVMLIGVPPTAVAMVVSVVVMIVRRCKLKKQASINADSANTL